MKQRHNEGQRRRGRAEQGKGRAKSRGSRLVMKVKGVSLKRINGSTITLKRFKSLSSAANKEKNLTS